jgi:hypothetical protein
MDSPAIRTDRNKTTTTRTHHGAKKDERPLDTAQRRLGRVSLLPGGSSSIVEITRFQLQRFTVSIRELAEWFGLELARIVVEECLAPRSGCRD